MNVKITKIIKFDPSYSRIKGKWRATKKIYLPYTSVTPSEVHLQFSKAPIMKNFGDLPAGEIPEPLKFNRPFRK